MPAERDRGSAAVEFALVLPLVMVLALALVQVGLLARDRLLVQAGATDVDPSQLAVEVSRAGSRGDPVTVTVTMTDPFRVPMIGWLMGSGTTFVSSTTMRQEFG